MTPRQKINTTVMLVLVTEVMVLTFGYTIIGDAIFSGNIAVVLLAMLGGAGWAIVHDRLGVMTAVMLGGVTLAAASAGLAGMV